MSARPFLIAAMLVGAACSPGSETPAVEAPVPGAGARVEDVRAALTALAHDSLGGRGTGTAGAARAARWIAAELARHGVRPAFPEASADSGYFQPVPLAARRGADGTPALTLLPSWEAWRALPAAERVHDVNVVGVIPGSDPALRDEAVVVGAHFDHEGIGEPVGGDSIYNGADDDASGVVAALEIARALAASPPARTVVLMLTTGEEHGMLGTRWHAAHPAVPLDRTAGVLWVEMIARPDTALGGPGRAWLTGYERSTLGPALAAAGVPVVADPRPRFSFFTRSDNIVFACRGVPAHTLSSYGLHGDYHTPDDEVERVDFEHMTRVVDAAVRAARALASGPAPRWTDGGSPAAEPTCAPYLP